MKNRENNYDLLRILACFAVIIAHVSTEYIDNVVQNGTVYSNGDLFIVILFNVLSKFAVVTFVMLSGAFLLSNPNNKNRKEFYKKSIKTILVPTLIFSVFYFFLAEGKTIYDIIYYGEDIGDIIMPIKNFFIGVPYYHMWYMYMLMGLYIIIPNLIVFIEKINNKKKRNYYYAAIIAMCLISGLTSSIKIKYSICNVIVYAGYLLLGYKIRYELKDKKNNKVGCMLVILGFVVLSLLSVYAYNNFMILYTAKYDLLSIHNLVFSITNFGPIICLSSSLIFAGFSKINIKKTVINISNKTFYMYLFHAIVITILFMIENKLLKLELSIPFVIILNSIISFVVSYLLSVIYLWFYRKIDKNDWLEKKIVERLKLK